VYHYMCTAQRSVDSHRAPQRAASILAPPGRSRARAAVGR
jgi:hypothetical protein